MDNSMATIIDGANGGLHNYNSKLVIFEDNLFVYLPKDKFKEVQKLLEQLGLVIDGNKTIYSIGEDVSYKVKVLTDAIKHKFKLTPAPNGNIKLDFKKMAENNGYYYFGQQSQSDVEKIMSEFIELNLKGFNDEEICKMFERKFKRK